jgi:hypothetical protein
VTEVINPLEVEACHTENCGGAHDSEKGAYRHSWECYLKYDIKAMLTCEGIYLIPGWEGSPGARLELFVAAQTGLKIYFDMDKVGT